jgi:predicted Zn-dependent protease
VSSYKKSLVIYSLILIFCGCSTKDVNLENKEVKKTNFKTVKTKSFDLEDFYIMYALETENQRMYFNARDIYLKLFENTNNYEYLVKYLTITTQLKEYALVKENASKYMLENIKEEEVILRLYAYALFKLQEKEAAILNAEKLIFTYKNAVNYELLGSIYLEDKQYLKSYEAFNNAFLLNDASNTLLTLTNIQFMNLNQKEEAIKRLENYIHNNDYNFNVSLQLLAFYENIKAQDRLVSFLKNMYFYYKQNDNQLLLNKTKALFLKYVVNNDVKTVIDFWEQNGEEDEILLNLYRMTNQSQKAYNLLNKFYKNSNNMDFLAQQAILEFEMAKDKKMILSSVINKFEKVLETLDNPIYQNYLAYILIDYDLNVNRGIYLVKKALEKDPANVAFLDTLAWGEYKVKNCKEAYTYMKQVVDEVGLDDEEIKLHWEKIKECKE